MARKAVQGYTEKSYYDNTKYLGMVATSDPISEGYFKHMVNMDISDTGQSVTPRKGYLTTTLRYNTLLQELISLSSNTILFKDNNIQSHIIYDFDSNHAFIADVSAYNIDNKLLPITHRIVNLDWTDVVTFLRREIAEVEAYAATGVNDGQLLSYIKQRLSLYNGTEVRHILDSALIHKTLIKVKFSLTTDYPFLLEIYYREDAVESLSLPADTLVFSVTDTTQHPTYDTTRRNIASAKSIIPTVLQNLYTTENRPDGHTNVLGMIYAKTLDIPAKYLLEHIYQNQTCRLRPHFDLSPASIATNDSTSLWAFRFDIVSTKKYNSSEDELKHDNIFRSPWYKYVDGVTEPVVVIPIPTTTDTTNADRTLRHIKGTRFAITLLPLTPDDLVVTDETGTIPVYFPPEPANIVDLRERWLLWRDALNKINSRATLLTAINTLKSSARFHVHAFTDEKLIINVTDLDHNIVFDVDSDYNVINTANTFPDYNDYSITGDALLELIDEDYFDGGHIFFKMLPYAVKNRHYDGYTYNRFWLTTINFWSTYSNLPHQIYAYNRYNMTSVYKPYLLESGKYILELNTYVFNNPTSPAAAGLPNMKADGFFDNGFSIIFYLYPYTPADLVGKTINELEVLKDSWAVSGYLTTRSLVYGYDNLTVTTIEETIIKEPRDIQLSNNFIIFEDNRLVVWHSNVVYMSEPGDYYYFKEANRKQFPERIVKVLQFKTILLVFTVQHLYAIYETEIVSTATDDKGKVVQVSEFHYVQQRVLYNIMASDKYADVIQVFNQMVLFYSDDGQMFMIKPSTVIDNETLFTLQYFNKSANDILRNYDVYINERLSDYNIDTRITKDQVHIKALVSITAIKIFYYVPGYITYILNYDVINNRYSVYDTLTFTNISDKMYIDTGELYLTQHNNKTYFTVAYTESNAKDTNIDMSVVNNFKKIGISTLLDTGNINLNNHLLKRYRDLLVTFKNLSASKLLFNFETVIDDVVVRPYYDTQLQVQDFGGTSYYVSVPKANNNDIVELVQLGITASNTIDYALNKNLFEEVNLLFNFEDYMYAKLLTHRSSILGMGKVFRLKLQFVSKGVYKIQNFGIIYKERRV